MENGVLVGIIGALFFCSLVAFAGFALIKGYISENRRFKSASVFEGTVLGYEIRRVRRARENGYYTGYFPKISYNCCGSERIFLSNVNYNHIVHPVGSHIKVYVGDDGMIIYKKMIIFNLIFGIIFLLLGISADVFVLWFVLREYI